MKEERKCDMEEYWEGDSEDQRCEELEKNKEVKKMAKKNSKENYGVMLEFKCKRCGENMPCFLKTHIAFGGTSVKPSCCPYERTKPNWRQLKTKKNRG